MNTEQIVAVRSSNLARIQAEEAIAALGAASSPAGTNGWHLPWKPLVLGTPGDSDKSTSLTDSSVPEDFFTRDLDLAVLDGRADFAVHSAKDLPLPLPDGLFLAALTGPADTRDALVARPGVVELGDLPAGARIGTSSEARGRQMKELRPDLELPPLRGTIEERLAQLEAGNFDAIIVAACALDRLGLGHRISSYLPFETHPLQGYLAVVCRKDRLDIRELWAPVDCRRGWGAVRFVGAGPGDPGLLTRRGAEYLANADTVYYDALVDRGILDLCRRKLVYVGKRKGEPGIGQENINRLLVEEARKGRMVVRLKGGDSMLFSRITEEIAELRKAALAYEIVPGVTAASAAAAYADMPLTSRDSGRSIELATGYPPEKITINPADTQVYYMGMGTRDQILRGHLDAGRNPATPAGMVLEAGTPRFRRFFAPLVDASGAWEDPTDPGLLWIGATAAEFAGPSWFEALPRIWYTGTEAPSGLLAPNVVHCPLIRILDLEDYAELDAALAALSTWDWIVFTSRHTVRAVFARLGTLGLDARALAGVRIAAVGRTTANELAARGLTADAVPAEEDSEGLAAALLERLEADGKLGAKILAPGSDIAGTIVAESLRAAGHQVRKIAAYRNLPVAEKPALDPADFDEIVLTSPSGVRALCSFFPDIPASVLLRPRGRRTREALAEFGRG